MTRAFDDLHTSVPEVVYARLDQPFEPDMVAAYEGLTRTLNLRRNPYLNTSAWMSVSRAMIDDPSAIERGAHREPMETGQRILEVVSTFPWLQNIQKRPARTGEVTASDFFGWSSDHVFDDCPGLFGVTLLEARRLRTQVQDFSRQDDPGAKRYDFAAAIGIIHNY